MPVIGGVIDCQVSTCVDNEGGHFKDHL